MIAVGVLMLAYVIFGGMVATTYVQIIKAVLLVIASLVMVFWSGRSTASAVPAYFQQVVGDPKIQARVASLLGDASKNMTPAGARPAVPRARPATSRTRSTRSRSAWRWCSAPPGMPHILMRFFTVPTAQAGAHLGDLGDGDHRRLLRAHAVPGHGAAMLVGAARITAIDRGGNMAAPLLAQFLGGGPDSMLGNLMLSFVAAVAFATIVAVVAGLVLAAASAMSHDIWVGVIKGEHATDEKSGARRASAR